MTVVAVALEDDAVRAAIVCALIANEYSAAEATSSQQALRLVFELHPDAIVLDPEMSAPGGVSLVRMLRAASDLPMVAVARERTPVNTVEILDSGADDVVAYATAAEEIVARIRSSIRRASRPAGPQGEAAVVRTGDLVIDRIAQIVTRSGSAVSLSRTEYRLLEALAARIGQVADRQYLLTAVWGEAFVNEIQYLRVYVGRLRLKIEDDPAAPRYVVNEWGLGYRLTQRRAEGPERPPREFDAAAASLDPAGGASHP